MKIYTEQEVLELIRKVVAISCTQSFEYFKKNTFIDKDGEIKVNTKKDFNKHYLYPKLKEIGVEFVSKKNK